MLCGIVCFSLEGRENVPAFSAADNSRRVWGDTVFRLIQRTCQRVQCRAAIFEDESGHKRNEFAFESAVLSGKHNFNKSKYRC